MNDPRVVESRASVRLRSLADLGAALWACIVGTFFLRSASFATGALLGLVLGRLEQQGWDLIGPEVGLLGASYFLIELVGAPVCGNLIDRRGFRTFLVLGPIAGLLSVCLEGATAAVALSIDPHEPATAAVAPVLIVPLFFLARSFHGLSAAISIPATLAFLSAHASDDPGRRSRAMAFFEVATIVGIGVGVSVAGRLWDSLGNLTFAAAAGFYVVSLASFAAAGRRPPAVATPRAADASAEHHATPHTTHLGLGEFFRFVSQPPVLRFVPAWIAVNAVVGLWIFYLPYLLTQTNDPGQLLVGGFTGQTVSNVYLGVGGAFLVGIIVWGYLLGRLAPTTVMQIGLGGLYAVVVGALLLNHASGAAAPTQIALIAATLLALTVAAAFTPAALTYLAALAEEQAGRRGAIMGLYSVFLGVGQGMGTLLGGPFERQGGANGLIALTFFLAIAATVFVHRLRAWERVDRSRPRLAKTDVPS